MALEVRARPETLGEGQPDRPDLTRRQSDQTLCPPQSEFVALTELDDFVGVPCFEQLALGR